MFWSFEVSYPLTTAFGINRIQCHSLSDKEFSKLWKCFWITLSFLFSGQTYSWSWVWESKISVYKQLISFQELTLTHNHVWEKAIAGNVWLTESSQGMWWRDEVINMLHCRAIQVHFWKANPFRDLKLWFNISPQSNV